MESDVVKLVRTLIQEKVISPQRDLNDILTDLITLRDEISVYIEAIENDIQQTLITQ